MVYTKKLGWPVLFRRQSKNPSVPSNVAFTISEDSESFDYSLVLDGDRTSYDRCLEKLMKTFFLTVIDECMDGLCILTKVYASFVKKFNVSNLEYQSVEARFAQSTDYGSYRIGNYYTDMHKLQKEIAIIQFLLDSLMSEVKRYGTFTLITEYMENLQNMREDEETLMEELREKSKLIDYIRCAHVKEKQLSSSVVTAYNNSIRETLRVYEEATEYALTEVNFVQKWQDARYEQNLLKLQLQESNFSSTAETMRWEIELEERCHEELEDYITESQQDYIDEIQIWMEQYEVALENKESQIYNMKMEIEKLNDEHERLQIDYDDRTREIEDWLEYKRKKEEEEKLLMLQTWAAMKIQAWWRGVMVRRKLGRYRRRKGKKGKGKGKNKKEKNKTGKVSKTGKTGKGRVTK